MNTRFWFSIFTWLRDLQLWMRIYCSLLNPDIWLKRNSNCIFLRMYIQNLLGRDCHFISIFYILVWICQPVFSKIQANKISSLSGNWNPRGVTVAFLCGPPIVGSHLLITIYDLYIFISQQCVYYKYRLFNQWITFSMHRQAPIKAIDVWFKRFLK